MPLNYFRTYMYHPLTLTAPSMPGTSFRFVPSNYNLFTSQLTAKSSPAGSFTPNTILAPTNLVGQAPLSPSLPQTNPAPSPPQAAAPPASPAAHQGPLQQQQQQQQQYPDMTGYHSMMHPSHPMAPHPQIHQGQTQQQPPQGHPHQHPQQRQLPYYPENPFQYIPPPPQYNLQQVQFVPCMCPVTLGLNSDPLATAPLTVEKRADETLLSTNSVEVQPQQVIETPSTESKA